MTMPESENSTDNLLYYGDNLDILRTYIPAEHVDLVYLDPPFGSNKMYNVLFEERNGARSKAQIKAFEDTWKWDHGTEELYVETVEKGPEMVSRVLQSFRGFLATSHIMAYLTMMAPRLVELRRVMKQTASIYLHCDPGMSHYLKILMDSVFGAENFRNEIVWAYKTGGRAKKYFSKKHDIILFYSKAGKYFFDMGAIARRRGKTPKSHHMKEGTDARGRKFWTIRAGGKIYRYSEDDLLTVDDVWNDISHMHQKDPQRLGYPTQKPEALLERIIKASSDEDHLVLDPFCGCGTTVAVAQRLKRRWIGIDITQLAITLTKHRLQDSFGHDVPYKVIGESISVNSAVDM